jgi:D-alanine-D-alanine ligase
MRKVAIITGGLSSERDISILSAKNVTKLLNGSFSIVVFDFPRDISVFLKRQNEFSVVVPIIHGRGGEDGSLQGFLETIDKPYLFSGVQASALAIDKEKTKRLVATAGLHVPRGKLLKTGSQATYKHPVVVKPLDGGSSVATKIVRSQSELDIAMREASKFSNEIIIEDFIRGREFTIAVIERDECVYALPAILINPKNGFFDFKSKYQKESLADEICPAPISQSLATTLRHVAETAHAAIGCRHVSRSDIIVDKNNVPWFLEINTIPGMTETSLLPKALIAAGLDLKTILCKWIVQASVRSSASQKCL